MQSSFLFYCLCWTRCVHVHAPMIFRTCSFSLSQTAQLKADFPDVQNYRCRNRDSILHQNTLCTAQEPRSSINMTLNVPHTHPPPHTHTHTHTSHTHTHTCTCTHIQEQLSEEVVFGTKTVQVSPQNVVLNLQKGQLYQSTSVLITLAIHVTLLTCFIFF